MPTIFRDQKSLVQSLVNGPVGLSSSHRSLTIDTHDCTVLRGTVLTKCSEIVSLLIVCRSSPSSALCAGDVQSLLETYDRDRRVLPPPVVPWKWGWTKSAETWNGRIAMLAIVVILLLEVTTGHGVLNHWPYDEWTN